MHIQQSDSAIMEQICWRWVNTVSTSTWPGSKPKRQATACVKVWSLDVFYRGPSTSDGPSPVWEYERSMRFTGNMHYSHTYFHFDNYKIVMTV